ncbi:MAG TPA: TetR/AcrR family transcriptional regulator [Anaeromyxobacteraceae bacterium]|nr:TetR/AcrR family transcriptional regulator [Anaeromyxobacteraceae bacterium]
MQPVPTTERAPAPPKGIASRLWSAARTEFSMRGYHGARVQGIARRAGCNVALLYRHWASKKALYLDVLGSVWTSSNSAVAKLLEQTGGAPGVVAAYLDALLDDPEGGQILVREYLDGAPFLSQLIERDPSVVEPLRRAVAALAHGNGSSLRPGLDPLMAAVTIGGVAALAASAQEAARPFFESPPPRETWRNHLSDLLLHGLLRPGLDGR